MTVYRASAPGKVILHGEHSVVYGKTALAVSLGIRTRARIQDNPEKNPKMLSVLLRDLSPEAVLFDVADAAKLAEGFRFDLAPSDDADHGEYLDRVSDFVRKHADESGRDLTEASTRALVVTLYVLCAFAKMTFCKIPSVSLSVESELEIGSGAGSSASFAVTLAAVALHYFRARSPSYALSDDFESLNETEKRAIDRWAYRCEKIVHGDPSGVDNSVCTYGSMVEFRKGCEPAFRSLATSLRVCLVNTKVKRSTKTQVERVVSLRNRHPDVVDKLMEACDSVASAALAVLSGTDGAAFDYLKLKELFQINHGLLRTLGVSHPRLELARETAESFGFGCKLTGAGGGGFAIVLLPPDAETEPLLSRLNALGFETRVARLGGSGVTVDV